MRELTFQEVIAGIKKGDTYVCTDNIYGIKKIHRNEHSIKYVCDGSIGDFDFVVNLKARFIKKRQSVSFQEALTSKKKVRVEHELLTQLFEEYACVSDDELIVGMYEDYMNGEYLMPGNMMILIGWYVNTNNIQDIINDGKWYIEE